MRHERRWIRAARDARARCALRRRARRRWATGRRVRAAGPPSARAGAVVIRVVIADDEALVRGGLRMILEAQPDIEIVGEAEDGRAALELRTRTHPDVVVMDIRMPILDGIEATRLLLGSGSPAPRV